MLFFSWILSVGITCFHLGVMLTLAPFVMALTRRIEIKIQGGATGSQPNLWYQVQFGVYKPLRAFWAERPFEQSIPFLIPLGMLITAALLVPMVTTGNVLTGNADFFLIVSLLLLMPCFFFMISFHDHSLSIFKKLQKTIPEFFLFFPMLIFIVVILRLGTHSTELNQVAVFFHHSDSFMTIALCSLFMSACSLFFLVFDMPDFSGSIERDGFPTETRAVLLYMNDLQFLVWLSLIAFLFWPQSIALLDLQQESFGTWLMAVFFGFLAWIVKIVLECVILAIMRNMLLVSNRGYRIGIATVLNFLAIIIYFAGLAGL